MKKKISITLSGSLLARIDRHIGKRCSRSAFIEAALRRHFRELTRRRINERDIKLINAAADYLNNEAEDIQQYQAPLEFD
jgi:metal-responsive CopG/Arc/MetJ family transcriptional regulator